MPACGRMLSPLTTGGMTTPGAPEPPMIARRVTRAEAVAEDIHLFELRDGAGGELPAFSAGSHVSVRVPNGLVRKY